MIRGEGGNGRWEKNKDIGEKMKREVKTEENYIKNEGKGLKNASF